MESTAGFTLVSKSEMRCPDIEKSPLKLLNVRLEIREIGAKTVALMDAPLEEWVWSFGGGGESGCYVYADSLYFTPRGESEYEYRLLVDKPWPSEFQVGPQIGSFAAYTP